MKRNTKILLILLAVALALVLYLVLTVEKVIVFNPGEIADKKEEEIIKVDPEELKANYIKDAKLAFSDLKKAAEKNESGAIDMSPEELESVKIKFLSLTVPADYKDFHLNLILAIDNLSKYLAEDDEEKINENIELIGGMENNL